MSEEKNQNAPIAEAPKQDKPQAKAKPDLAELLAPPSFPVNLEGIPKEKLEMAESFGIPIGGILQWVSANQQWQSGVAAVLGKLAEESTKTTEFLSAVQKRAAEVEAQRSRLTQMEPQAANAPSGNMGLLSMLQQFAPLLTQATATPDPLQEKFKAFMEKQLEMAMNPQPSAMERLGESLVQSITSKVGAKTAEAIANAIGTVS